PVLPGLAQPYGILVTGVGGTGVITIGQIIAMAAHVEGRACSVLDMSGLAQKGGPVMSHVRVAEDATHIHSTRVGTGMADLVIGCDVIVTAGRDALSRMGEGRTHAAVNSTQMPTAAFVRNPDWQFPTASSEGEIAQACGRDNLSLVDAGRIATALMGDAIATNMFMLGYAWQKGWVPLSEAALLRAIELNALQVDFNKQAFAWGRVAAHDVEFVLNAAGRNGTSAQVIDFKRTPSLDELVERRVAFLTDYQNAAYARSYRDFVEQVRQRESALGEAGRGLKLSRAVANYLFKLMAYKDEYEVARLHSDPAFRAKIAGMFEGDYKLRFHLAPPLLARRDEKGHLRKQAFGSWMMPAFGVLARLRFLRGTAFDPFGYTGERRQERALIGAYRDTLMRLLSQLTPANLEQVIAVARVPEGIRGYGHVKERHLQDAKLKEAALLAQLGQGSSQAPQSPQSPPDGGKQAA
ncbi:DUF6537 domain-containing protein, partial [Herbaspirillum frisingense]